jgi:hypothetical protein
VDDYDLSALLGSQVRRVAFDERVSLLLVDSTARVQGVAANLVIEAAISFRDPQGAKHEVRPGVPASLAPMLQLLRCHLTSVTFDGRELAITFDDGSQIAVFTGERYEAWDLRGVGVPNLIAGPWCLTDDSAPPSTGDQVPGEPWPAVPALDSPIYGLSPAFAGRRALGAWDRNLGEQFIGALLDHGGPGDAILVTVGTVNKNSPLVPGPDDLSSGPTVTGFEAALSQALFGLLQLEMPPLGEGRTIYLRERLPEMDQLGLDLGAPGWERTFVKVGEINREAHIHRLGRSWAAAIDLDARVGLGLWGRGIEPNELELVEIDDLDTYAAPTLDA